MIQKKYYKTIKVLVNGDGGETPFYIENIDTQSGTLNFMRGGERWDDLDLYYRLDDGNWTKYNMETNDSGVEVQAGQKIYFKGDNPNGFINNINSAARFQFFNNGVAIRCNVGGYITSLMSSMNSKAITNIPEGAFAYLMGGTYEGDTLKVISAKDMRTDNIKTVGNSSFEGLFKWNTSLTEAPSFANVVNVSNDGFKETFKDCHSLVVAPTFENMTTVGNSSFFQTFYNCTSLVTAPRMENVTTGSSATFLETFYGCTSLVTAPVLGRLQTLGENGARCMFMGCTALQVPPTFENFNAYHWYVFSEAFKGCSALKTTPNFRNLTASGENSFMFNEAFVDCSSLQTIIAPRFYHDWEGMYYWTESSAPNWVVGVPATGTFYKKRGMEIPFGLSGIPEGWNVIEED